MARNHTINYVEIAAPDLAEAKGFYASAFGWAFNAYGDDYAGIQGPDGDGEVGGLNPHASPGAGGPLVILYADDLDTTLTQVRAAGGQITQEPYAFPGGRRFHFADPAGNGLAVWSTT
ncbi:VOC family protein [Nocardioides alcanivorans]|uniref:VOC family protein n=1 Tax=Nocardioides alcanivorans TaxID=2897352 RepID=UPI001F23E54C|nr:VOC family protein [Nocardioides alcanivorans]